MRLNRWMAIAGLIALTACGSTNSNSPGDAPKADPNGKNGGAGQGDGSLTGKLAEELLKTKYDRVELVCEIRLQVGSKFQSSQAPEQRASWDLLKEFAKRRTIRLATALEADKASYVLISIVDVKILPENKVRDGNTIYEMQFTPELSAEVLASGKAGRSEWSGTTKTASFSERIQSTVEDRAVSLSGDRGDKFFSNVVCTLHTEAKQDYKSQFKATQVD